MRYYIANASPAMVFGVNGKKVWIPSPQMKHTRGWALSRLRGYFKMRRIGFFEVARESFDPNELTRDRITELASMTYDTEPGPNTFAVNTL